MILETTYPKVVTHPWVKMEIAVINLLSNLVTDGLQSQMIPSYRAFIIIGVGVRKISEDALGEHD